MEDNFYNNENEENIINDDIEKYKDNDDIDNNLYLVYVELIGKNPSDQYEYDFFFSETPEVVWGTNWESKPASICGDLKPETTTYSRIRRLKSIILFDTAQGNSCFSMMDAIDGVIALAWENIDFYESYPEAGRIVLNYGDSYITVENKLAKRHQLFSDF